MKEEEELKILREEIRQEIHNEFLEKISDNEHIFCDQCARRLFKLLWK